MLSAITKLSKELIEILRLGRNPENTTLVQWPQEERAFVTSLSDPSSSHRPLTSFDLWLNDHVAPL